MGLFSFFRKSIDVSDIKTQGYQLVRNGEVVKREGGNAFSGRSNPYAHMVSVHKQLSSYSTSVIDFACISATANAIASLPVRLYEIGDREKQPVFDNGLANNFIDQPNPNQTWYDFTEMLMTMMELTGYVCSENVYPKEPKECWPLRPDLCRINTGRYGIKEIIYSASGNRVTFDVTKNEAFQIKYVNPLDVNRGQSAYNTIQNQIAADIYSTRFVKSFFENGAHIDGILNMGAELTPKQKKELEAQIKEKYSSSSKAFKMFMLYWKDAKYEKTQVNPKEADVSGIKEMDRGDIMAARKVPPVMIGFLDGATYANATTQIEQFYKNAVMPKARKLYQKLSSSIFNRYGLVAEPDYSGIEELKRDEKQKADTALTYAKTKLYTRDEIRSKLGDSKFPGEGGDQIPETDNVDFNIDKALKKKAVTYRELINSAGNLSGKR